MEKTIEFNVCLDKWEDKLLAKALISQGLFSTETIKEVLIERSRLPVEKQCKLGQLLVQKRLLEITDYTKTMVFVKKQAQVLYEKLVNSSSTSLPANISQLVPSISKETNSSAKITQTSISIPDYEIQGEIARGGMGIVYKVRQIYLDRIEALKLLRSGGAASENEIRRFQLEAEAVRDLRHPNIVTIYQISSKKPPYYFTMEFIDGETLKEHMKRRSRKKKLVSYLVKIANALDYAHRSNILHRDIKPSNIIINLEDEPKITDFGLAKRMEDSSEGALDQKKEKKEKESEEAKVTEDGKTMGTPFYMSPEQTLGSHEIDGRSDIYSLGVILYEILAGRLPFKESNLIKLYHKIVEEEPVAPSKCSRKVDKSLETICLKCMEKNVTHRYQTCKELSEDLDRYLKGEPILAKPMSPWERWSRQMKKNRQKTLKVAGAIFFLVALGLFLWLQLSKDNEGLNEQEKKSLMKAQAFLQEARELKKKNQIDKALRKFEQTISTYPKLAEAYLEKGDVYQRYKDYQKAIEEYERVLKIDKTYALAYYRLGYAYMELKSWNKAIEKFTLAIQYNAQFYEAYEARGKAYQNRGVNVTDATDFQKSIQDYQAADKIKREVLKSP